MTDNEFAEARIQISEISQSLRAVMESVGKLAEQLSAVEELLTRMESAQQAAAQQAAAQQAEAELTASTGIPSDSQYSDAQQVMVDNAEFLKTAIHELRTPMTSIRGYSDMLSNPDMVGELSDMQSQLLKVVRSNSRRMETLLSDMSYVNKIRADILVINKKMDMFKNIAMRAEKDAQPMVEELHRQLEFDIPQGLPLLNTDGELMTVALLKLIENGLRYSQPETGKVIVRGKADGSKLVVTVEDNGIGMDEDTLSKIGTLYFRADDDLVRSYKGSGLGVAIAYGLISALEGSYSVSSEPGKGTTFTLTFPAMT